MSDYYALYDDILRIVIAILDSDSCIILARVNKHLHKLVHDTRKIVVATDNIFEAVRSNLLVSFMYAKASDINHVAMRMQNISTDMLKWAYNQSDKYYDNNCIAYQLCKRGILTQVDSTGLRCLLIIHAITYNKRELLTYMNNMCDEYSYRQACAYGYAKIGDYERFIRCNIQPRSDFRLVGYAIIGGDQRIIKAAMTNYRGGGYVFEQSAAKIIKKDDHDLFTINKVKEHICYDLLTRYIIRYNALNIVRKCDVQSIICERAQLVHVTNYAVGMTLDMAKLLLEVTNNDIHVVRLITNAYDYRLTEMLRARGLYSEKLTARSSHKEFMGPCTRFHNK